MRFDIITTEPNMFNVMKDYGVIGKAYKKCLWNIYTWNPRSFSLKGNNRIDDKPYGGGVGMVMQAEPFGIAVERAKIARICHSSKYISSPVILLTPHGTRFTQQHARNILNTNGAILVTARYRGIDHRFTEKYVTNEISLGDFILSCGEIAAFVIIESVVRLLPFVLKESASIKYDSFHEGHAGLLSPPDYTRPKFYNGISPPQVLLSGNHKCIQEWNRKQSLAITYFKRPDLITASRKKNMLSEEDEKFLSDLVKNAT